MAEWAKLQQQEFLTIVGRSAAVAFVVTLICLALAHSIVSLSRRLSLPKQNALMAMFAIPLGVDALVKIFGWSALIGPRSLMGVLSPGLSRLNDATGANFKIVIVMVLVYLPMALIPIWVSIRQVEPALFRAATDCGANYLETLVWINWPLSQGGTKLGSLLVWISALTNFLIPDLVGGSKTFFLGDLIKLQYFEARNWPLGAVLSLATIALGLVGMGVFNWLAELRASAASEDLRNV